MLTTIAIIMAIYMIAMVAISWMGKKYANSFEDYVSAGKSCGIIMMIGGAMGAHIGNGLVVGGAGECAGVGFSGIAYGIGCCISYLILPFVMNHFVYSNGYLSMGEYLSKRYHNFLPAQIFTWATVFSFIGLVGGQLMAGGALFEALGMSKILGVVIIAMVVFLYSQISGLWGAFATSVVQTAVILVGLGAAGIYLFQHGAITEIRSAVEAGTVPATFMKPIGGYTTSVLIGLVVPVSLQIITDQATFQRINSGKTEKVGFWGHILSAFLMIPIVMLPVFIGMYGKVHFDASGSSAFFDVILNILPPLFAALVVTAVIAAVMSTIDAAFVAFSQLLLSDVYRAHIKKDATDKELSNMSKVLNIVITLIAITFALKATSLVGLLANCYLFCEAAILVPFVGGRIWKKGSTVGAIASSLVGSAVALLELFGVYALPYSALTMFIPAALVYIVVSLMVPDKAKTA